MALDSKNLEKLSSYSEKISKNSSKPNNSLKKKNNDKTKLHPIETEKDPIKLFQELIKASRSGEVPDHLIKRLKELERKEQLKDSNLDQNDINNQDLSSVNKNKQASTESELYTSFKMLLLEED